MDLSSEMDVIYIWIELKLLSLTEWLVLLLKLVAVHEMIG